MANGRLIKKEADYQAALKRIKELWESPEDISSALLAGKPLHPYALPFPKLPSRPLPSMIYWLYVIGCGWVAPGRQNVRLKN
jgi:hypothetical protein